MTKGLTLTPFNCKVCGKPLELPRPSGKHYHNDCLPEATRQHARQHYIGRGKSREAKRYHDRKEKGLCVICGVVAEIKRTLCKKHLSQAREKQTERINQDLRLDILNHAKQRAKRMNLPFDLELEDIVIPDKCPILGFILKQKRNGKRTNDSPSLDRIIPEKGYVKGNVVVISWLANNIKGNFNADDIIKVGLWMKGIDNGF